MRNRFWKIARSVGLFILIVLTLSISLQLELPAPSGPYTVGRTILRWVDSSRPEVLTDDPNDFREVMAFVWYPAVPGTGTKAGYFPDLSVVSKELVQSGEVAAWEVFGLRFIRSKNNLDAEPVKNRGAFPVVLLSPGGGTEIEFYSSLASEIASRGYIVVGINHPYDVAAVELTNGSVAPYDKAQWLLDAKAHQIYTAERIKVRTADVLFVLNQLETMNTKANNPFVGILDLNSVAVAGHSLGGITASEACKADARFKACINFDGLQAGGPFSTDPSAIPPQQPFLFLTKESQLPPKLLQKFESTSRSYWVVIHGASHQSFSDGPVLQPSLLPLPNRADRLMTLIQTYTLAFLDQTLKGQPSSLLADVDHRDVSVKVFPSK
jgi:dienelactone hydrolase